MAKAKRKLASDQRRARRQRKRTTMIVFFHGKQRRVPRPRLIEGLPVEEFIASNADPIWLHQDELWHLMPGDGRLPRQAMTLSEPHAARRTGNLSCRFGDRSE